MIIDAHTKGDEERFRRGVLQISAGLSHEGRRKMLQELLSANHAVEAVQLRSKDYGVVLEAPDVDEVQLELTEQLRLDFELIREEWLGRSSLLAWGLRPRERFLFYGPPGNGKTTQAIQFARSLGLNVFVLSLADTVTKWKAEAAVNIRKAFELLRLGHALILDEFDTLADHRQSSSEGVLRDHNHTVATMLTMLDRQRGGLLIATSNRKDMIDPAMLRRFDDCLAFPAPTENAIGDFIAHHCRKFGLEQSAWPEPPAERSYDAAFKAVLREVRYAICHGNLKAQGDPPCLKAKESAQPSPNI